MHLRLTFAASHEQFQLGAEHYLVGEALRLLTTFSAGRLPPLGGPSIVAARPAVMLTLRRFG